MRARIAFLRKGLRLIRNPKKVILHRMRPDLREEERLSKLTGPAGYWKELRNYQINFLKTMGMQPHHSLIDIGCGPLQGGIAFIAYLDPGKYVGVDISDVALVEAYVQIAKHNLVKKNPRLAFSSSFGLEELSGFHFDYAWTCQTLYHLDETTLNRYFQSVSSLLKPGGLLYADIIGQEVKVPKDALWRGLRHFQHTVEFMRPTPRQHGLTTKNIGKIKDYGYPVPCELGFNDMLQFEKRS